MLIDSLLVGAMLVVLAIAALIVFGVELEGWNAARWLAALIWVIVAVLVSSGYFIFFEWWMRGQTPGKKSMKIRVIRDDGTPTTANEVLVRNILRIVDFLPGAIRGGSGRDVFPSALQAAGRPGSGNHRGQGRRTRLSRRGRQETAFLLRQRQPGQRGADHGERRLLTGFLQRRAELLPKARQELAERLAGPLHAKYGGQYDGAERDIERLVEGRHYGA